MGEAKSEGEKGSCPTRTSGLRPAEAGCGGAGERASKARRSATSRLPAQGYWQAFPLRY